MWAALTIEEKKAGKVIMGLFDGMEAFGVSSTTEKDMFEDPKAKEAALKAKMAAEKKFNEEDFLFEKTYECPVCYKPVKEHTIRAAKARLIRTAVDLRPTFEGIEPLKYDVVQCKECGFTALTRYFVPMTAAQRKAVTEKISANFKKPAEKATYSYDDAVLRYRLALVNAVVRQAKASEKAYICLRGGWLCSSYLEDMNEKGNADPNKIAEIKKLEEDFLKNAYEGFVAAEQNETFPMCGMDESTLDYLIAALAIRFRHLDVASKLISNLLLSQNVNGRIKDKVRDLKEEVIRLQKEAKK